MGATWKSAKLDDMIAGLTLEQAQERLEEALANGEIETKTGRKTTGEMGYYALRLFATGSHQYEGNEVPEDLRAAAWKVYKETSPPESSQRRNKEYADGEQAKVRVSRTKGLHIPYGERDVMLKEAQRLINEWCDGEGQRIQEENEARAKKAAEQIKNLGISEETLAALLKAQGFDLSELAKLAK